MAYAKMLAHNTVGWAADAALASSTNARSATTESAPAAVATSAAAHSATIEAAAAAAASCTLHSSSEATFSLQDVFLAT